MATSEQQCICGRFAPVTEAAALAAADWAGKGDALAAAAASRRAMAKALMSVPFRGRVVAGRVYDPDGEGLFLGSMTGAFSGEGDATAEGGVETSGSEAWDLAVKPLEGQRALAKGLDGALSLLAVGPSGSLVSVPDMYMQKLMVGGPAAQVIDIDAPVERNITAVAAALGKEPGELTVAVLDRARHEELIEDIKRSGARLKLMEDGDISAGIATAVQEADVELCIGIGGSTEGIITAAAMRCLGGAVQARFWPVSRHQVETLQSMGFADVEARLSTDQIAGEGVLVAATAVTRGRFLDGVKRRSGDVHTETLLMCSRCSTVRVIKTVSRRTGAKTPVALKTM